MKARSNEVDKRRLFGEREVTTLLRTRTFCFSGMDALRKMELDNLVSLLVAEHEQMRSGLGVVREAVRSKDYASAAKTLADLDKLFRQHIADEEGQILRVLINALGVKGAEDAIQVFRQHRPIYELMETLKKLASIPPAELEARNDELQDLFEHHAALEEGTVFPHALSVSKKFTVQ
jgi:hemerythrin-like domain-containing protein